MKLSPKRLSFDEIWKLYKIIGKTQDNSLIIDEIISILDKISNKDFDDCLNILGIDKDLVVLEVGIHFMHSLIHNEYILFQSTIGGLNGSSK